VVAGTRIKEASVKKLKYVSLAVLVVSLLAIPAVAQKARTATIRAVPLPGTIAPT
jgi:hypothetical protein